MEDGLHLAVCNDVHVLLSLPIHLGPYGTRLHASDKDKGTWLDNWINSEYTCSSQTAAGAFRLIVHALDRYNIPFSAWIWRECLCFLLFLGMCISTSGQVASAFY